MSSSDELPVLIETPEELAQKDVCAQLLLGRHYGVSLDITSIEMHPLSQAILSQVVEITLCFGKDPPQSVPSAWIAKFQKDSLPLRDMFRVEGCFYEQYAREFEANDLNVSVPTALYCGEKCIVLAKIQDTTSYTLLESLPPNRLQQVFTALARVHGHFWGSKGLENLSATAGIGSAMSGEQKEQTFPTLWQGFVNELVDVSVSQKEALQSLCQSLSKRRLRDIHARVHNFKPTLIHGDFHVGNMLFSSSSGGDESWLLDWATCGAGNPMVDVVFFVLVSTRITIQELMETWLPYYYKELTCCTENRHSTIEDGFSYETCVDMLLTCLLNQFLVLVCYDKISKTLLEEQATGDVCDFYKEHFLNVNRRCVDALLSDEMNLQDYPLPPIKTNEDELEQGTANDDTTDSVIREL